MTRWKVRLSEPAQRDFVEIVGHTADAFGPRQARVYEAALRKTVATLTAGPEARGTLARDDLGADLRTLHISRTGVRGRHLIVYRAGPDRTIEVLRILHDAMDLGRHVPTSET